MSAVAGRTLRVGLLTTLGTNIGDDWTREGIRALLDTALPDGYSPLYVAKWSQASLREPMAGEELDANPDQERDGGNLQAGDKYWDSDLFIIAGAPVYWHLTGGRHRSLDAEWHTWMYADRVLAGGPDDQHPVLLNLGAGGGQPWGDDGACFVNDPACAAFARELGWRSAATVVRDRVAASILNRLEVPHRLLPCPAFLAPRRQPVPAATATGPIGVNLMHLGGHFALDPEFSPSLWRERCAALLAGLRTLGRIALIAHDAGDQRFMEHLAGPGETCFCAADWRDYHDVYSRCPAVVSNRVQGAIYAAGCGIPAVIVGNDTRALAGEPIGIPVERSATVAPGALVERVRSLLANREVESSRLRQLSDGAAAAYGELIRPALAGLGDRPRRSHRAPAKATARQLAFITGCGRSGTTILGRILEHHGEVRYFNDRFDLWVRPFPFADIWGYHPDSARSFPRVALAEEDARVPEASREWFLGQLERERGDRPVLVEKLAINNFRLGFLTALCPDALFINIVRHGVEVAYSIAAKAAQKQWYGADDRKWRLLTEHAWAHGYGPLLRWCTTPYHRGLLEWRMSVDAAATYFERAGPERVLRLRYEELLAEPEAVCERLRVFLGLSPSEGMRKFAAGEVRRQNPSAKERTVPRGTEEIAGGALRRLGYWS